MTASFASRPHFPRRAVVTAGMPYGNKGLHFGHIGGVFVPADFYARFLRDRIGAQNVVFVSGTDCYGSPIMEGYRKLAAQGYEGTITDYVSSNHQAQKDALAAYEVSLNFYGGSGLDPAKPVHAAMTDALITRLYERGYLTKRETLQFYDTEAHQFLNGRQVQGRCPVPGCKSEKAYADECDLGHQFEPEDLISPISQVTGTVPELRPVANWYFDLPAFEEDLKKLDGEWSCDPQVRDVVATTVREFLVPPAIYIKNELREQFDAIAQQLPAHTVNEPKGNAASFSVAFESWDARDEAREVLDSHSIRFRAGKCLLPFRITGNIDWGVPAPDLDNTCGLTVWCWPESLWAPISFTQTLLQEDPATAAANACDPSVLPAAYSSCDWHDWWCEGNDTQVFQFIGQDNIYFYCVAQPAIWEALDWNLFQDTPVANYHILFMNKKASSSGAIKPPMAADLLSHYTPEQLRCHWLSLGLGAKAVSFAPKPYDTSVSHKDKKTGEEMLVKDDPRVVDPALKESAFLTNIFNRLARSCFYGAQKHLDGKLPRSSATPAAASACDEATLAFELAMYELDFPRAMAVAEDFGREANKLWDAASKAAKDDEAAYEQALADAFCALRTLTLLMHPAAPAGCQMICEHLNIDPALFFSWDHAFESISQLLEGAGIDPASHQLVELPPRTDFFSKHESQFKKK